jgi:hypothetical protein
VSEVDTTNLNLKVPLYQVFKKTKDQEIEELKEFLKKQEQLIGELKETKTTLKNQLD